MDADDPTARDLSNELGASVATPCLSRRPRHGATPALNPRIGRGAWDSSESLATAVRSAADDQVDGSGHRLREFRAKLPQLGPQRQVLPPQLPVPRPLLARRA